MCFYVATQLGSRHMKGTPLAQALSALSKALDLALDEGMLLSQARTEGEAWRTELGQQLQAATEDPRGKDKSSVRHLIIDRVDFPQSRLIEGVGSTESSANGPSTPPPPPTHTYTHFLARFW
jgi:hypothetical protein